MSIHPISYLVEWKPAGSWAALTTGSIIDFTGGAESALSDAGLGFGDKVTTRQQIQVLRSEVQGQSWARTPFRVTPTVDGGSATAFAGVNERASGDAETVTFNCVGMTDDLPARTKDLYSPMFYRRPAATKTTASSIEDPATGGYAAGPINWVLWQAGGRPYEQAGTYPTADFYYSCDQAIIAPDWAWIAGEDGWGEALRLARAAGGQLYQAMDGVVRYKSPLLLVSAATCTYADTLAGTDDGLGADESLLVYDADSPKEEETTGQYFTKIVASFTPRSARPMQEVINDSTPRKVEPGETITVNLEPQWPLTSFLNGATATTLPSEHLVVTRFDGEASTNFTHTVTLAAQRVEIAFTNNETIPLVIYRIIVHGTPVTAGETQTIEAGSGTPVMAMEDNIFVQNRHHALQLATMGVAFYGPVGGSARKTRTITAPYHTDRVVGETVGLTCADMSLMAAPHLIYKIGHEAGEVMTLAMVDVTGIPVVDDYYLVSTSAQAGPKKVAW